MSHVFISYVREDSDRVDRLKTCLGVAGVRTWIDRDGLNAGENWRAAVRNAVEGAAFFVACFSYNSAARERTEMFAELREAIDELRKRPPTTRWFLPVLLDEVEVPDLEVSRSERLGHYEQVRLYEDWPVGVERLLKEIEPGAAAQQRERRVLGLSRTLARDAKSVSASTPHPAADPQPAPKRQPLPEPKPRWVVQRTRQVREGLHGARVTALAFDSIPRLMTAGGNVTHFWGLPRLEPIVERLGEPEVTAAVLDAAGRSVATASADRIVRLWDSIPGDGPALELDHGDSVQPDAHWIPRMAFSASGDLLATGSVVGELRVWDTVTGKRMEQVPPLKHITALAFGPFTRLLAIGLSDATIGWCDVETGQQFPKKEHPHHYFDNGVDQVLFSPDGARLVSVGRKGSLRAWDVESGSEEQHLCRDSISRVAFGPSPTVLAGGGMDGSVYIWETDTGRELFRGDHPYGITQLAFSPDGEILATISEDVRGRVWDIRSGEATVLDEQYLVRRLAFAPNGNLLATTGVTRSDHTTRFEPPNDIIRVWTGIPEGH